MPGFLAIFGYRDVAAEQFAIDTGIAFQLTNILRDVREDVERGRIYLSADMFREYGVEPARMLALSSGAKPNAADLAMLGPVVGHLRCSRASASCSLASVR